MTDERLKSWLNANQVGRERMCLSVLAIDKRFSNVQPRHPEGGPDGGRDIVAVFEGEQTAFNTANDSREQKREINKKFQHDLVSALQAKQKPQVFIFLTNVGLTVGEKDNLVEQGKAKGLTYCEIFDRERIRIALDSADGFSIRFQYLNITLSEAEQASFFARWGDDIQSVISNGFQKLENTLDRILFYQEASTAISYLYVVLELDRTYTAEEIKHFRAFCNVILKEAKQNIWRLLFGSSDMSGRVLGQTGHQFTPQISGIKYGISSGQWECHINATEDSQGSRNPTFNLVGGLRSVGMESVTSIDLKYRPTDYQRLNPKLCVRDLDECTFDVILNRSLAEKVAAVRIFANEYKLQELSKSDFVIRGTRFDFKIPIQFTEDEISDPWVRISPADGATYFDMSFSDRTPRRLFSSIRL
ncbi:MAG: hypothetical protein V4671_17295 [Armatimonadota bacterium]